MESILEMANEKYRPQFIHFFPLASILIILPGEKCVPIIQRTRKVLEAKWNVKYYLPPEKQKQKKQLPLI